MKDTINLLKLYIKVGQPRLMIIIKTFLIIAYTILITILTVKDLDYIVAVSLGFHMFYIITNVYGQLCKQFKFYKSMKSAKSYVTTIPFLSKLILFLPIDIYHFAITAGFSGMEKASEIALFNAIFTICACTQEATIQLPKIDNIGMIISFFNAGFIFYLSFNEEFTLGLSMSMNLIVALAVYIVGAAAIKCLMNLWWKKSGRTYREIPNFSSETIPQE